MDQLGLATTFKVHPMEMKFYLEDPMTYVQQLIIHNPWNYPVQYQVKVQSGKKFIVVPHGVPIVKPHSLARVSIRYPNPVAADCNLEHLFVVCLSDVHTKEPIGKKFFVATLLSRFEIKKTKLELEEHDEEFTKSDIWNGEDICKEDRICKPGKILNEMTMLKDRANLDSIGPRILKVIRTDSDLKRGIIKYGGCFLVGVLTTFYVQRML